MSAWLENHPLLRLNTFGVEAAARMYAAFSSLDELPSLLEEARRRKLPPFILGGGSNLLLTGNLERAVLHNRLRGIAITGRDREATLVPAAAGEPWQDLVEWTLRENLGGLENLALVPGSVGAAPVQNIGAYGVEVGELVAEVEYFDRGDGRLKTLAGADCGFGYRRSRFKGDLRDRAIVVALTLRLPHIHTPRLAYRGIREELDAQKVGPTPTPAEIARAVSDIRRRKLPDPAVLGSAGSFFKNPVVAAEVLDRLRLAQPEVPSHPEPDGRVKIPAGWLIEKAGWKGRRVGACGVHKDQALVLVNYGGASGAEIRRLAESIQAEVCNRFGIRLEPEVEIV